MNVFEVIKLFGCQIENCGGGFFHYFYHLVPQYNQFIILFIVIIVIIIIIITFPATDAGQNLYSYNHLTHLVLTVCTTEFMDL